MEVCLLSHEVKCSCRKAGCLPGTEEQLSQWADVRLSGFGRGTPGVFGRTGTSRNTGDPSGKTKRIGQLAERIALKQAGLGDRPCFRFFGQKKPLKMKNRGRKLEKMLQLSEQEHGK